MPTTTCSGMQSRGREEGRGAGRWGEELPPEGASSTVWATQQPPAALQLLQADRHGHRHVQTDMPRHLRGRNRQDRCAHCTGHPLKSGGVGAGAAVAWGVVREAGTGVAEPGGGSPTQGGMTARPMGSVWTRLNGAVIKGFEKDVGTKTSFYGFTVNTMKNSLIAYSTEGFTSVPRGQVRPEGRHGSRSPLHGEAQGS